VETSGSDRQLAALYIRIARIDYPIKAMGSGDHLRKRQPGKDDGIS